jgi:hypothetical protein
MKISLGAWFGPCNRNLRHDFLISPLAESAIVSKRARVYYCARCKWNFLVCEKRIAALDGDGNPIGGDEGRRRFETFGDGPCPALAQSNVAAPQAADNKRVSPRRNSNESRHLAPVLVCTWAGRARDMFRVSTGLRENLGDPNDLSHLHRGRTHLRLLGHRHDPA